MPFLLGGLTREAWVIGRWLVAVGKRTAAVRRASKLAPHVGYSAEKPHNPVRISDSGGG